MANSWRDDLAIAIDALNEAAENGSSWVDLLIAEHKIQTAKEFLDEALTRLSKLRTVRGAKKHVGLTKRQNMEEAGR
jgi:hypothetical protein